jgi:RecG-like helicase
MPPFKIADLVKDAALLRLARRDAAAWIKKSPHLDAPEEALLRKRLLKSHGPWLELGDVG